MTYSDALREFIKSWECPGGRPILEPHWDAIGMVWDIGYGHVIRAGEQRRAITAEEAEMLFDWDMHYFDDGLSAMLLRPIAQCQYDALCSFAYNVGLDVDDDNIAEGLGDSTLLRYVNAGDFPSAACEFAKWNKANGKIINGLVKRRAAERAMFEHGDYSGRP